jgi:hypothetical protein
MVQQTWQTHAICTTSKSSIRDISSSLTILQTTIRNTTGVGIHTKSIGKMCSKQKNRSKAIAIIWHVDELKISHASKDEVEDILKNYTTNLDKKVHSQQVGERS